MFKGGTASTQLLVLAWTLVVVLSSSQLVHGKDANVYMEVPPGSTGMTLKEAVLDPTVTRAVIQESLVIKQDEWLPRGDDLIPLNRSLTITAAHPNSCIDFNFTQESVQLLEDVTFQDICVNNTRWGGGFGMDFFSPQQGSVVKMVNTLRLRLVCTPSNQVLINTKGYPRPDSNRPQQLAIIPVYNYTGHTFYDSLHLNDFSREIVPDPEAQRHDEDYILEQFNVTRLCYEYVTPECVRDYGDDLCIQQRLNQILRPRAPPSQGSGPAAYAIAVPVVLGVLLIALVTFGLLWRRRHARQGLEALQSGSQQAGSGPDRTADMLGGAEAEWKRTLNMMPIRSGPLEEMVQGNQARSCWQLVAYSRAAGKEGDFLKDKISLGVLLGAGSFGRVYKGRWHEQDVAIKVLQHDGGTASAVANEVDLMMSFNHPNVVKAYQFVTWALNVDSASAPGGDGTQTVPINPLPPSGGSCDPSATTAAANGFSKQQQVSSGGSGNQRTSAKSNAGTANGLLQSIVVVKSSDSSSGLQPSPDAAGAPPLPPLAGSEGSQGAPADGLAAAGAMAAEAAPRPCQQLQQDVSSCSTDVIIPIVAPLQHRQWPVVEDTPCLVSGHVCHDVSELNLQSYEEQHSGGGMNTRSGSSQWCVNARARAKGSPAEAQTWLILEYCDGGTLLDMVADGQMHDALGNPCMGKLLTRLRDVAAGMQYLHARNVLHGDLKSLNILITSHPTAPYGNVAKVSDFGLSRSLKLGQTHRSTRTFGTVNHMSPEQLRLGKMSPAGDVYAFGIMMWELYTGQQAFQGCHYGEVFEKVALHMERPPIPEDMLPDYSLLMSSCWNVDPVQRPGFDSVLKCLQVMLDHCEDANQAGDADGQTLLENPFVGDL